MRISDWSSDVCSSDLAGLFAGRGGFSSTWRPTTDSPLTGAGESSRRGATMPLSISRHAFLATAVAAALAICATTAAAQDRTYRFELPRQSLAQTLRSEEHTSELQSLMRISSAVFCLKK